MHRHEVKVVVPTGRQDYVIRWLDPLTGQLRQKTTGTSNRRKAERMAQEKVTELKTQAPVDDQMLWKEFRDRYEEEVLTDMADLTLTTFCAAANALERICKPKHLIDVDASTLSKFAARRRKDGKAAATVAQNIRHIRAALSWAVELGILDKVPRYRASKRERAKQGLMRGRPINEDEFKQMLKACRKVRKKDHADWQTYLKGLWLSGLRASEAAELSWDDGDFQVDMSGRRPRFKIFAEGQKAARDEYAPMTPDFVELLKQTPKKKRQGKVFAVGRLTADWVKRIVSDIGECSGVLVDSKKEQYAGSHTLRKSFGSRWARRVKPAVLQRLMRHAHIQTTMQYYVDLDVDDIADEVWAWRR